MPTQPLTPRRISQEALALVGESGYAALTVRALARRLGVKSSSLYNHVATKDDILDGMADLLGERIDVRSSLAADSAGGVLHRFAHSYRAAFRDHPELTAILARRPVRPRALDVYDEVLGALVERGMSPEDARHALAMVEVVVMGSVVLTYRLELQTPDDDEPLVERSGSDNEAFDGLIGLVEQRTAVTRPV